MRSKPLLVVAASLAAFGCIAGAQAVDQPASFLGGLKRHSTVASTVPANGDQNPYAVVVSPVTTGKLVQGHVLVGNFNNDGNLQGAGGTIVSIDPATKTLSLFASVPRTLDRCPGGVGLTAAMAVLRSGWTIIGSLPSKDGTTATKGQGCLLVFNKDGQLADVWTDPKINGPWGNMAVIDKGDHATLFVSNTGYGVGGAPASGDAPVVSRATVVRIPVSIPAGGAPTHGDITVVADGFAEQADKGVFIIGPTGVALGQDGAIYVSDAIGNSVARIPDALTRSDSAGTGTKILSGGSMNRPLALVAAPNGHLLTTNGLDGRVVEIDPVAGREVAQQWIDVDKAQQPAGSGDLFGLAITPDGKGFYYVEDDVNTLVLAH